MERVLSTQASEHIGHEVLLKGWAHRVRDLGRICFISLRDRAGEIQLVLDARTVKTPPVQAPIAARGVVVPKGDGGEVELQVTHLAVLNGTAPLPLVVNRPEYDEPLDVTLDYQFLAWRHPQLHEIVCIRSRLSQEFRAQLNARGFIEIHTPKILGSASEGGADVFPVKYFEREAYLSQSPQLYKQLLVGAGYERVFEVGPAFRAEKHNTSRHTNQFTSLDAEMGFIEGVEDVIRVAEEVVLAMLAAAGERGHDIGYDPGSVDRLPRVSYREALSLVRSEGAGETAETLGPADERRLGQVMNERHGCPLLVLTDFPVSERPFYTLRYPDGEVTAGFDILYRGEEILTGGQRVHEAAVLRLQADQAGIDERSMSWYLEAFRYGMPPHGGFAIGLERVVKNALQLDNIRWATLFPRDRTRLAP